MRNLKKILALVLALVMSLSLMATAGAAFTDAGEITESYQLAVDVLNGVNVFKGYDNGSFVPKGNITRAEAAALIYRISTGDVTDTQKDIYTAWNGAGKLSDVSGWYAGYVNYSCNAGYIKGYPNGTFQAQNNVTGYEVLAMVLRTLGYGRNGEFEGSQWAITTASLAQTLGITKNIRENLGDPATREMVAEIIFRAIFCETQQYNALHLYEGTGTNLAKENLGLERITGVVMANEWANINEDADEVLANGTTEMLVDGRKLTLSTSSELDAVGLTYNAYIQNETTVIGTLEMSDVNKVAFNEGAETTVAKLAKGESLSTGDAMFFLDYDEDYYNLDKSDYLVRYAIAKDSCSTAWTNYMADINGKNGHTVTERTIKVGEADTTVDCWVVSIRPDNDITETDVEIMKEIFYTADRIGDKTDIDGMRDYAIGEVYIGTASLVDQSDELSWKEFVAKYFNEGTRVSYEGANNGESLRVVDNNGDGKAEYVFKVQYWQDRAVDTYKDTLEFNTLRLSRYTGDNRVIFDDLVVGDVVNYSVIDSKLRVWKADIITDVIQTKNFKDVTVTTAGGETKGQSEIFNETDLDDNIMMMDEKVEYNMYLDEFGYIRTYELAQGSKYALLTEIYTTGNKNFNYVNDAKWIAEVTAGDAKTEEYTVANRGGSVFRNKNGAAWTSRDGRYGNDLLNYLQPAIAHLDNVYNSDTLQDRYYAGDTTGSTPRYTEWDRGIFEIVSTDTFADGGSANDYGVFDYGPVANKIYDRGDDPDGPVEHSFSFTNVAAYALDSDGETVTLNSAAKLATDRNGNQLFYKWTVGADGEYKAEKNTIAGWAEADSITETAVGNAVGTTYFPVYAVDYVQLQKEAVKSGMRHFAIDENYGAHMDAEDNFTEGNYYANSNGYVNATVETEFYIVQSGSIQYYSSYSDLPTIKADDVRAAYAVASNIGADADEVDYWVADVIVIETNGLVSDYDSISLMYYNPRETTSYVRYVDSLNNQWRAHQPDSDDEAKITVYGATGSWGNSSDSWSQNGYGFYKLYDTEYADGELSADRASYINANYNDYGIYAGTLQRINELSGSRYFDVDTHGRDYNFPGISDRFVVPVDFAEADYQVPIYRVSKDAENLRVSASISASDVQRGDELIWVLNKAQNRVAFIVDLGSRAKPADDVDYTAPTWLSTLYQDIVDEQVANDAVHETPMDIVVNLDNGEKLTLTYGDQSQTFEGTAETTTFTATFNIPNDEDLVDIGLEFVGADRGPIVPGTGWTKVSESNTLLRLGRQSNAAAVGVSPLVDEGVHGATVYTIAGAVVVIEDIKAAVDAGSLTQEEKDEYTAILAGIDENATADMKTSIDAELEVGSKLDDVISAVDDAEVTPDLTEAKATATAEVEAYKAAEIAELEQAAKDELATALQTAKDAIEAAETQEAIDRAVQTYKDAVDEAVLAGEPDLEGEALTNARNAAKTTVAEYEATAVGNLSGQDATDAAAAKTEADSAIDAATKQSVIDAAVQAYKDAIDALIAEEPDLEGEALTNARNAAKTTVAEYEATAVGNLSGQDATDAAAAKTEADSAIDAATKQSVIDAAVQAYKDAIDALIAEEPDLEGEALTNARNAAKTTVAEYEATAVGNLSGQDATDAAAAKTEADSAIDAATKQSVIDAAVQAYKDAIDALIA